MEIGNAGRARPLDYQGMTDPFPRWPPDWIEDHELDDDQEIAAVDDVVFRTAQRSDGQILMSLAWPEGSRYLMVEPVGMDLPQALRAGEISENPETARAVEGMWSQALTLAKKLLDGDINTATLPPEDVTKRRRPWRRAD